MEWVIKNKHKTQNKTKPSTFLKEIERKIFLSAFIQHVSLFFCYFKILLTQTFTSELALMPLNFKAQSMILWKNAALQYRNNWKRQIAVEVFNIISATIKKSNPPPQYISIVSTLIFRGCNGRNSLTLVCIWVTVAPHSLKTNCNKIICCNFFVTVIH